MSLLCQNLCDFFLLFYKLHNTVTAHALTNQIQEQLTSLQCSNVNTAILSVDTVW